MGEDGEKKSGGVPSWQLKPSHTPGVTQDESQETTSESTPSRASIIEDARRFLQEDEVRNAPTDKQVAFLESKGLERHEIEDLLGASRIEEASSKTESNAALEVPQNQIPPSQSPAQPPQSAHDTPPIITYPEFLITPPRPAPLVTANRLLTTLYLFGGLSALLCGTGNYLIAPMVASLTSSRQSLSETAQSNLDRLISRLSAMVSSIPDDISTTRTMEPFEDVSDGDPTEVFHRDIGVQTSGPSSPSSDLKYLPTTAIEHHDRRLTRLSSRINDITEAFAFEEEGFAKVSTCIGVLRDYLDSLTYVSPVHSHGPNGIYTSTYTNEAVDDEISRVKARIRSVKGVLLNARSFPGGTMVGRAR